MSKKDKPIKISTRTTINLSSPDLVCYPQIEPLPNSLLTDEIKFIQAYDPLVNELAQDKTHPFVSPTEMFALTTVLRDAISEKTEIDKTEWLRFVFKTSIALHLIATRTQNGPCYLIESYSLIDVLSTFSDELTDQPEEIWWYYAAALNLQIGWSHDEGTSKRIVDQLTTCLDEIHNKKCQIGLVYFILHIIEQGYFYPDISIFEKLSQAPPIKMSGHESYASKMQDIYIRTHYMNPDYLFYGATTGIDLASKNRNIRLTKQIQRTSSNRTFSITVSQEGLIRFSAHLCPPTKPILNFEIPGCSETEQRTLNLNIRHTLNQSGYCNTEGIVRTHFYSPNHRKTIEKIIMGQVDLFMKEKNKQYLHRSEALLTSFYDFSAEINRSKEIIDKLRKAISGYTTHGALVLAYLCLIPCKNGLEQDELEQLKQSLAACIIIYSKARSIYQNNNHFQKHKKWFSLAKDVANQIYIGKKVLLAVGSPIKEGESYSTHAIYACLKRVSTNDVDKIIGSIANGGRGVKTFHQIATSWDEKDTGSERYHYAGLETEVNDEHKTALIHYIYRVISLEYEQSASDDLKETDKDNNPILDQSNPYTYSNLFRNLYLRTKNPAEEEFFLGSGGDKFTLFKRKDPPETFRKQTAGTCTMFNCIRAIKYLFEMKEPAFGRLQHNLLIGFDMLITELKETQNLPTFSLKR